MDASQRGKLLNNLADLMERDRYSSIVLATSYKTRSYSSRRGGGSQQQLKFILFCLKKCNYIFIHKQNNYVISIRNEVQK